MFITDVPVKVPDLNVTNITNGSNVDFTLQWGEPSNNYDPIIMYHVSCSGDAPCPQSYNTANNRTRSHTFTGFTPKSYYTFSVIAINSIGSGEAGVVMVGEIISATITPSVVSMSTSSEGMTTTATITYISSHEDISMTTSSEDMIVDMSSEIMMNYTSTVGDMSATMSSVSTASTMTPTDTNATATGAVSSPAGITVVLLMHDYIIFSSGMDQTATITTSVTASGNLQMYVGVRTCM